MTRHSCLRISAATWALWRLRAPAHGVEGVRQLEAANLRNDAMGGAQAVDAAARRGHAH